MKELLLFGCVFDAKSYVWSISIDCVALSGTPIYLKSSVHVYFGAYHLKNILTFIYLHYIGNRLVTFLVFPLCTKMSVISKKLPNVYRCCPKMISLEIWKIFTPLQKLLKNVGDFGKLNVAKGFEKLPNLATLTKMHVHSVYLLAINKCRTVVYLTTHWKLRVIFANKHLVDGKWLWLSW